MLSLSKVFDAQTVLKNIIRETNVVRAYGIAPDCELYLKPENLQITGSFKVRGSAYKIACLSEDEKKNGVIACSAGNHAQGVALAATKNGIKSLICLPDTAPISKVEATKGFGADVCLVEGCYDDAYKKALELEESEGYTFVHPFDDENVIAGRGTIALKILNDLDNIDAIVVPIGGGGMIGVVEDGDIISINIPENTIELKVEEAVLSERMKNFVPKTKELSGYLKRYAALVSGGASGAILN